MTAMTLLWRQRWAGLQEETESAEELAVHPLNGNILLRAALGKGLFQITQLPFVFVGCPLGDAWTDRCLPVFLEPSLSHQEKDCKDSCLMALKILQLTKRRQEKKLV